MSFFFISRVILAVLLRPGLWRTALRQGHRLAPRGWWGRPPFLPLPDVKYLNFRAITHYGKFGQEASISDVLEWLSWCRNFPKDRL